MTDKIHDIENLSFAELKARRGELTAEMLAGADDPKGLVDRYLQARTDAKQRDEKLAEQGKTITALQDALAELKDKNTKLGEELLTLKKKLDESKERELAVTEAAARIRDEGDAACAQLQMTLSRAEERSSRLKAEALRNRGALSAAAKLLNDALANTMIEDADLGRP